jgi:DNA-binding HxlR family transcriptional regulator
METIAQTHVTNCPIEMVVQLIGGKWKVVILHHLLSSEVLRFNELQRKVKGSTQKMLTQQLRELERDGLVSRKIYPVVPPKVEYRLTKKGESLRAIIVSMDEWGRQELHT